MRSPFPGMDPYLEDPGAWGGVHGALIVTMREVLNSQLAPGFVADGGTSVYILSPEERRWMFPDVFVIETADSDALPARRGAIAAPVRINITAPETISLPSILIRDRESREVVTIIELLSPVNKGPESVLRPGTGARAEFLRKRRETMQSRTHWLEIDLLRAGERPPEARDLGDYYALLKRAGAMELEVWPLPLRDRLKTIAVPLTSPHDDVPLDLQTAVDTLFARHRYANLLNYRSAPPPPPFRPDDARWVADRVRQWQTASTAGR